MMKKVAFPINVLEIKALLYDNALQYAYKVLNTFLFCDFHKY